MPSQSGPDTDELLDLAKRGEGQARQQLLTRHRDRLRKMVAYHMDRRVAGRIDPSDVVQEALADAARELSEYLRRRPVPFYPWLRQLAWDRLVELHRRHLHAGKRSVRREEPGLFELPDESAVELAGRLASLASSPSAHVVREEVGRRVREALTHLGERDREVLVLRHLEQLSTAEAAAVLGLSEAAFKSRHLRALQRLRGQLGEES
ncbi:MAG: sigma-70 family RNA polymerase sigma factor [Gemmataceae bacterium]